MAKEKRKRENDEEANGVREKPTEDDGDLKRAAPPLPGDEEVEEFFAILKRIQVAVKYFQQQRDGVRCNGGVKSAWSPSFQREDFDGVRTDPDSSKENGLDLNSDPAFDDSGSDPACEF